MQERVFIISAVRTPIGAFGGSLKDFTATELGAHAVRAAIEQAGIAPEEISDVIMGCVLQANLGQAPARQAAKLAGLPDSVNCSTINKVCASGMKAVAMATQSIRLGDAQVVVAGGMESMSNTPFYAAQMRWGNKYGNATLVDGLAHDGLTDAYDGRAMGNAAELCASVCGVTREEQDAFAIQSYQRAQAAWEDLRFAEEVVPLTIRKKSETVMIDKDEDPFTVKYDKIPTLKTVFQKDGTVTPANASSMNDGAAALVLIGETKMKALGLQPLVEVLSYADAEQAPEWFTTSPSLAVPAAVNKAGLSMEQIEYWELNEAFAVVGIENSRRMNLDPAKVNVNGGAVALGHPLGCSGARIIVTLIHVLKQHNAHYGAAGICNGGGGASALVIKR